MKKILKYLAEKKRAVLMALCSSLLLLLICYFVDNSPFSFLGDATIGQTIEQIKGYFGWTKDQTPEDIVVINISYDRALVDVYDEFGLPKGNIDITDREKLLTLLDKAKDSNYKYLILDLSFDRELQSEFDEELYRTINSLDNVVVAKSETYQVSDSILPEKARYSDYSISISENNFVKYEYLRNGEPTLPYQVFLDLYGQENRIRKLGPFYFFNGHLAKKSVILKFPIKLWSEYSEDEESDDSKAFHLKYYNLGSDVIDTGIDVNQLFGNKIVIVGDVCENDFHDTYLGSIAGPIINLNAFYGLVNDDLSIPYSEIIILFLLYSGISLFIIQNINLWDLMPWIKDSKSKAAKLVTSFVGLTVLFFILAAGGYLIFGIEINIFVPAIYFTILGYIVNLVNNYYSKKQKKQEIH